MPIIPTRRTPYRNTKNSHHRSVKWLPKLRAGVFLLITIFCFRLLFLYSFKNTPAEGATPKEVSLLSVQVKSSPLLNLTTYLETELNPSFAKQVSECIIPAAAVYGYDLYIASGFRSYSEEDALYAQGRTVDGNIVSNAQGGQSFHNFGYAVDLADRQYGEDFNYVQLGNIAAWCGIEHGDRGYVDLPHFQYRNDLSLQEFQAGLRPLPIQLPCSLLDQRAIAKKTLSKEDLASCNAPNFSGNSGYVPGQAITNNRQ